MNSLILRSPAKLNLFLKVLNKRSDGYHNIVTLFERINLCDEISIKLIKEDSINIKCNNPHVPLGKKNIVNKVEATLKEDFSIKTGVDIKISKNIPVAAGLGGGSSNAASVLLGLNKLWNLKLDQKRLMSYARSVGSDVGFFVSNSSWALGEDRGDNIKNLRLKAKLWRT